MLFQTSSVIFPLQVSFHVEKVKQINNNKKTPKPQNKPNPKITACTKNPQFRHQACPRVFRGCCTIPFFPRDHR